MKILVFLVLIGCGVHGDLASEVTSRIGKLNSAIEALLTASEASRIGKSGSHVLIRVTREFVSAGDFLHHTATKQAKVTIKKFYDQCGSPSDPQCHQFFIWIKKYNLLQKYKSGEATGANLVEMLVVEMGKPASSDTVAYAEKLTRMDDVIKKHGELEYKLFTQKELSAEEFVAEFRELMQENSDLFHKWEQKRISSYLDNIKKLKPAQAKAKLTVPN